MNNNIDFKELWKQQETAAPDVHKLIRKAKRFKRTNLIVFTLMNVAMILTFIYVAFILRPFDVSPAAKIGVFLLLITMLLPVFMSGSIMAFLVKADPDDDTNSYLEHLIAYKAKLSFFQTKGLNIFFALFSIGFLLFLMDFIGSTTGLLVFVLTFLWIGFNWFYLRPKLIKKRQGDVDDFISKFKAIKQQLEKE